MRKMFAITVLIAATPALAEGPAAGPSSQADDGAAGRTVGVETPPKDPEKREALEEPKPAAKDEPLKDTSNPVPAETKK